MATASGNNKRTRKVAPSSPYVHQHQVTIPTSQPLPPPPAYEEEDDLVLAAEDDFIGDASDENVDQRVHLAQERLSRLRKETEQIEREKQQLEELRRQQQSFLQGRTEMTERLSRAVAFLDRETQDCRRKVEQMIVMRDTFADHLESVNALTPEDWSRQDLQVELSRALSVIEDAKLEYDRNMTRLQAMTQAAPVPTRQESPEKASALPMAVGRETFRQWAFCGLAFCAPLLVFGVLALAVWLIFR